VNRDKGASKISIHVNRGSVRDIDFRYDLVYNTLTNILITY